LKAKGADINVQDDDNNTPLHYAFCEFYPNEENRDVADLTHLLKQDGIDVNIKDANMS
jgi:ankyrin repeat protein